MSRSVTIDPGAAQASGRSSFHLADGPVYTSQQVRDAWKYMSRGDKEGLRKRDVELLIRTFRPNITSSEMEQIVGPIKGRVTFTMLRSMLQAPALPRVRVSVDHTLSVVVHSIAAWR